MRLYKELQRRNVFRVALGYGVSSWLLLQVADVVLEVIGAPVWVLRAILLMLALGFVVAVFFSWAYEVTPEGIRRETEIERSETGSDVTRRKLDHAIVVMLVIALVYFIWEARFSDRAAEAPPGAASPATAETSGADEPHGSDTTIPRDKSIAVLPFANRSSREEDRFFADGIHDDLLTSLAKISSLKVISRTSTMRYRDTRLSIPEIAAELGVATVLEGGIQRAGDQVRINVQLIDAASDEHLWAENYDRDLSAENLFAIQSEISREIVTALRATMSAQEGRRLDAAPTTSLEAYGEYVLGRQEKARRTVDSLNRAQAHFEKAIELDPSYVLAYVGLADTLNLLSTYGDVDPRELNPPRQRAIERALALDPDSGEAYTSLAALRVDQMETEEAERFFLRAIELSPNYSTAYHWYSYLLDSNGRSEEALPPIRKALELDPMASILTTQYAHVLWNLGQVEAANAALLEGVRRNPSFPNHYMNMAANLRELGRLGESMHWLHANLQLDSTSAFTQIAYCKRFLDFDDDAMAERCFDEAESAYPKPSIGSRVELWQYRHRFAEALEEARRLEQRFPLPFARISLGWNHINNGQYDEALAIVEDHWPELLLDDAVIDGSDALNATVVAGFSLYASGRTDEADRLLDRALAYMSTIHRIRGQGYSELDVIVHVLRGDRAAAVRALRDAVDSGWRDNWWRLRYPFFDPMLDEPEWVAMIGEIEADIARQKRWFEAHKDDPLF